MKNRFSIYFLAFMATIILGSCKDDDKIFEPLQETELGGFVRFVSDVPAFIRTENPGDFVFEAPIEDPNGNVVEYTLQVFNPESEEYGDVFTTTTFPTEINFTSEDVANVLGVPASEFEFAQQFEFRGVATTSDGRVYSGAPVIYDPETGEVSGGDTDPDELLNPGNNYRDALEFALTIACPSVELQDITGEGATVLENEILVDGFGAPLDAGGLTREIIEGPGENQITILTGVGFNGSDDLVLNIDPVSGDVSYGGPSDATFFFNGPDQIFYTEVSGNVLTCVGLIQLQIAAPFGGPFGQNTFNIQFL